MRRRWPPKTRRRGARSRRFVRIDVGDAVVHRVDGLVGVERGVQRRVDVLRRVTHEGAEVDEVTARGTLWRRVFGAFVIAPAAVVVVTARSGDERQPEEDSKEL